jgi:hypothetical protein
MNTLLMYLLVSIKVESDIKKYLALVLKLCYHYGILLNSLEYYTEWWIIQKSVYYSVENNVFSRLVLFKDNIYNINWTSAQSFPCNCII